MHVIYSLFKRVYAYVYVYTHAYITYIQLKLIVCMYVTHVRCTYVHEYRYACICLCSTWGGCIWTRLVHTYVCIFFFRKRASMSCESHHHTNHNIPGSSYPCIYNPCTYMMYDVHLPSSMNMSLGPITPKLAREMRTARVTKFTCMDFALSGIWSVILDDRMVLIPVRVIGSVRNLDPVSMPNVKMTLEPLSRPSPSSFSKSSSRVPILGTASLSSLEKIIPLVASRYLACFVAKRISHYKVRPLKTIVLLC